MDWADRTILLGLVPIVIDIDNTEPVIASAVSACRTSCRSVW